MSKKCEKKCEIIMTVIRFVIIIAALALVLIYA